MIFNSIVSPNHPLLRVIHVINICVLTFSVMIAACYRFNYAKRDLLKTDEEEI